MSGCWSTAIDAGPGRAVGRTSTLTNERCSRNASASYGGQMSLVVGPCFRTCRNSRTSTREARRRPDPTLRVVRAAMSRMDVGFTVRATHDRVDTTGLAKPAAADL